MSIVSTYIHIALYGKGEYVKILKASCTGSEILLVDFYQTHVAMKLARFEASKAQSRLVLSCLWGDRLCLTEF